GRAIRYRQVLDTIAEKLDELADDFGLAQHLRDGEHQIGGSDAAAQLARQIHTDHVGGEEVHGLAEHPGFGLDSAHTPADYADPVDHGGVAVGADQRVGVVDLALAVHATCQVLQVDLVHNADARRHHFEGVERLHSPLHELVTLAVALEFQLHVQIQ